MDMKERWSSSKAQKQTRRSTFDINHKEVTFSLMCCEIDRWALLIKSAREIRLINNIIFTHITSPGTPAWFCAVFLLKQHLCTNIFITEHVK